MLKASLENYNYVVELLNGIKNNNAITVSTTSFLIAIETNNIRKIRNPGYQERAKYKMGRGGVVR